MNKLVDKHAIPGVLAFEQTEYGLIRACVSSTACTAAIYLQGAHLAHWQPAGHKPVLFLSDRSTFLPGKAIRGGVPIIFPWFGARTDTAAGPRTHSPAHGFARTAEWRMAESCLDGDDVHLTLTLDPGDTSRELGYDRFHVTYKLAMGNCLDLQLTVENRSQTSMVFEEALHSYFTVGDVRQIAVLGLANTDYVDKTDGFKQKRQQSSVLNLSGATDRPYLDTEAAIHLDDPILKRRIKVEKVNSKTTIIWNPWSDLTAKLADMSPDGWLSMVCIETANALKNAVVLEPGSLHTMQARITVEEYDVT